MGKGFSRGFKNGDEIEIVQLYNLITRQRRTVEQHRWEWLYTPEGQGSIWVIEYEENDDRKIIGHHGLIPIKFSYFGQSVLAGKTENTILNPQYSNKILYFRFEEKFIEEAKRRFGLLYTTSGIGVVRRIRERLGYRVIGCYGFYVKIISIRNLKEIIVFYVNKKISNKFFSMFATVALMLVVPFLYSFTKFSKKKLTNDAIRLELISDIDEIASEIDEFWDQNKESFGITADKNSRYLKWRIFDNPYITYSFFLARKDSEVVGYAIMKKVRGYQGEIVDIHIKENNEKIFDAVLTLIVDKFKEDGVCLVGFRTILSNNFLNQTLMKNGFKNYSGLLEILNKVLRKENTFLLAKAISGDLESEKLFNPVHWYFTDILCEGIG